MNKRICSADRCDADISRRHHRAKYCEPCAEERKRASHNQATTRHRQNAKQAAVDAGHESYAIPPMTDVQRQTLVLILDQIDVTDSPGLEPIRERCSQFGCDGVTRGKGLCHTHLERLRLGRDMEVPVKHWRSLEAQEKICPRCGWVKPLDQFHKQTGKRGGRTSHCKTCRAEKNQYRQTEPARICSHPSCDKEETGRSGLCGAHFSRKRSGRPMDKPEGLTRKWNPVTCTVSDCDNPHSASGYCRRHYKRLKNGVPLDKPMRNHRPADGKCIWVSSSGEKCQREWIGNGLCGLHDRRRKNGQDMDAPVRHALRPPGSIRTNTDGYQQVKTSNLTWVPIHRYVMEQHLGRSLLPREEVHHINGDPTDNKIENLELWSTSQPAGQRVIDKVAWARDILNLYGALYPLNSQLPFE